MADSPNPYPLDTTWTGFELGRLRRRLYLWATVGLLAAGLAAALVIVNWAHHDRVVRADRLELVDEHGVLVTTFAASNGVGTITVHADGGATRQPLDRALLRDVAALITPPPDTTEDVLPVPEPIVQPAAAPPAPDEMRPPDPLPPIAPSRPVPIMVREGELIIWSTPTPADPVPSAAHLPESHPPPATGDQVH